MKVFHQSQYPDVTDLTGYKTKSLGLLLETVRWCFLAERKKINWIFESFNESLLTASQLTSLSFSIHYTFNIIVSISKVWGMGCTPHYVSCVKMGFCFCY